MKIKNLMLNNFAAVHEISVSFDDKITFLIGENGAGKTTAGLNGIWFILKGLSQKGDGLIAERFRFIGKHGKSAKGALTIYDKEADVEIKVSRKLLKNKTELKIEASDGRQLDQAWLDSIFNPFCIDPMGFSQLSGKAQALAFGADTASFDVKKKELEDERRDIGRDVTRLQGVVDSAGNPEQVEMVDIGELMAELDIRRQLNSSYNKAHELLADMDDDIRDSEREVERLEKKMETAKALLKADSDKRHDHANEVQHLEQTNEQEIQDKIQSSQEINLKATAYNQHLENQSNLKDETICYDGKSDEIRENEADRTKHLQSLDLPWPNITINDDGEFRLNDKPFAAQYFSTGEILKMGARIASKLKGGLKYVYFPNSQNLDDKNRKAVFEALNKDGFQIVAEVVSTEKIPDESCLLLKEMRVVESYDDNEGKGLK